MTIITSYHPCIRIVFLTFLSAFLSIFVLPGAIAQTYQEETPPEDTERIQSNCYVGVLNRFDLVQSAVAENGYHLVANHKDGVPSTGFFDGTLQITVYNPSGLVVFTDLLTTTADYILGFDVVAQGNQFVLAYKPQFNVIRVRYYSFAANSYQITYDRELVLPGIDFYSSVSNEFENTVRIAATSTHYYVSTHVRNTVANQTAYLIARIANGLAANALSVTHTSLIAQGVIPLNANRVAFSSIALDKGRNQIAYSYHYQIGLQQRIRTMLINASDLFIQNSSLLDVQQDFTFYKFSSDFSHNHFLLVHYHFGLKTKYLRFDVNANTFSTDDFTIRPVTLAAGFSSFTTRVKAVTNFFTVGFLDYNSGLEQYEVYHLIKSYDFTGVDQFVEARVGGLTRLDWDFIGSMDFDLELNNCFKYHIPTRVVYNNLCRDLDSLHVFQRGLNLDTASMLTTFILNDDSICAFSDTIVIPIQYSSVGVNIDSLRLQFTSSVPLQPQQYTLTGDTLKLFNLQPSQYVVQIFFNFLCGAVSDTFTGRFTVRGLPPNPILGVSPAIACPGVQRTITINNTNCINYYYYSFGPSLPAVGFGNCTQPQITFPITPSSAGYYIVGVVDNLSGSLGCVREDSVFVPVDTLAGSIVANTIEGCRGFLFTLDFKPTNPLWNQVNLTYEWTLPPNVFRGFSRITSFSGKVLDNIYFDEAGTYTISLTVRQGTACSSTFTIQIVVAEECCRPQDGTINGLPVSQYFHTPSGTENLGIAGETDVLNITGGTTVVMEGSFHLYDRFTVKGNGTLIIERAALYVQAKPSFSELVASGTIIVDDGIHVVFNESRIGALCNEMWDGLYKYKNTIAAAQTDFSGSFQGIVHLGYDSNDPLVFKTCTFYNNLMASITDWRENAVKPTNIIASCTFESDPTYMKRPFELNGPFNVGDAAALSFIRLFGANHIASTFENNTFDGAHGAIVAVQADQLFSTRNTFRNFYRKGILAHITKLSSLEDTFHFTLQAPSLNASIYTYNAPKEPFMGLTPYDIASIVEQNAIPGTTLVSSVQQTGITATLSLSSIRSAFKGASGAGQHFTGIELINSEVATVEQNEFERLEFGIRRYIGTSNTTDDIRSNTFTDNTYGLLYTGAYPAPGPVSSYNPRLNCNQFVKTYSGLPWATGVMLHTGARIQQIGGTSFGLSPSGNGWVGLNPANQGYAVHNTTAGHLVDYFAYDNEILSSGQLVNVTHIQTPILAEPFIDPLTQVQNPNATCINNPAIVFLRPAGISDTVSVSIDELSTLPKVTVHPNPSSGILNVEIYNHSNRKSITFHIRSIYGDLIKQAEYELRQSNKLQLDLRDWRPGVYYLHYQFEDGLIGSIKIVRL